jgi:hypothetical protein
MRGRKTRKAANRALVAKQVRRLRHTRRRRSGGGVGPSRTKTAFMMNDSDALLIAAQNNDVQQVKKLLKSPTVRVNAQNENGYTALYIAAWQGYNEIIRLLLADPRTDPNIPDKQGTSPLFVAINIYTNATAVQLLLNHSKLTSASFYYKGYSILKGVGRRNETGFARQTVAALQDVKDITNTESLHQLLEWVTTDADIDLVKSTIGQKLVLTVPSGPVPSVPSTVLYLNVNGNKDIRTLPPLPAGLLILDCNKCANLTLPPIPDSLVVLRARHSGLKEVPPMSGSAKELRYLDLRDNQIRDYVQLDNFVGNKDMVVLVTGNELPIAEQRRAPPITILSKKRVHRTLQFRASDGQTYFVNTMIIPKGTILFRSAGKDKVFLDEFYGLLEYDEDAENEDAKKHYLHSNYNVFFYPYPYAAEVLTGGVFGMSYSHVGIFQLVRDCEVIFAVEPSPNSRANRLQHGYVGPCTEEYLKSSFRDLEEHNYDACLDLGFIKQYPEIVGYFQLAKMDADKHLVSNAPITKRKYWTFFRDSGVSKNTEEMYEDDNDTIVSRALGIPEIVLYPLQARSSKEIVTANTNANRKKLGSLQNYRLLHDIGSDADMEKILQAYLAPAGHEGKHMTIDLATKLFVIWEDASPEVQARCVDTDDPYKLKWFDTNFDL